MASEEDATAAEGVAACSVVAALQLHPWIRVGRADEAADAAVGRARARRHIGRRAVGRA